MPRQLIHCLSSFMLMTEFTILTFVFVFLIPLVSGHAVDHENLHTFFDLDRLSQTAQESGLKFDFPTLHSVPVVSQTTVDTPAPCAAYTAQGEECPAKMVATNVTFNDCGSPYTVCHCSVADISLDESIRFLGRVPIGLRRYMGTVMIMPGLGQGAHAYTYPGNGEIHFFQNVSFRTWLHEATHAADGALNLSNTGGPGPWASAVAVDSCVPDTYSQTNLVEDLAQISVVKIYMMLNNGQLPPGFKAGCMQNQLDYLASLPLYDNSTMFGSTCDFSPAAQHDAAPVNLATSLDTPPASTTMLTLTTISAAGTPATSSSTPTTNAVTPTPSSSAARHHSIPVILGMAIGVLLYGGSKL